MDLSSASASSSAITGYNTRWSEPRRVRVPRFLQYISRISKSPELLEKQMEAGFHKFEAVGSHLQTSNEQGIAEPYRPGMVFSGFTVPICVSTDLNDQSTNWINDYMRRFLDNLSAIGHSQDMRNAVSETRRKGEVPTHENLRYAHFLIYNPHASKVKHATQCGVASCLGWITFATYVDTDSPDQDSMTTSTGIFRCNSDRNMWTADDITEQTIATILSDDEHQWIETHRCRDPESGQSVITKHIHLYRPDLDPSGEENVDDESDSGAVLENYKDDLEKSSKWAGTHKDVIYP
ncbi:hypothetical protein V866_008663 [Kwoniella sp. B9012]